MNGGVTAGDNLCANVSVQVPVADWFQDDDIMTSHWWLPGSDNYKKAADVDFLVPSSTLPNWPHC